MKRLLDIIVLCLVASSVWADQVATPVLQPDSGTSSTQFRVTITCTTPNALLRYTTNGEEPTVASETLTAGQSVLIGRHLTLKAKAWDGSVPATLDPSETASAIYQVVGAVGAGAETSLALSFDGKLRVWGRNDDGRLGLGTMVNQLSPAESDDEVVSVDGSAADSLGLGHTVWARNDGTVWSAGNNNAGQLGNNSTITPGNGLSVQVQRQGGAYLSNVLMVAAGKSSSYALTADGYVYSWGANGSSMRLGDGGSTDRAYADTVNTAAGTPLTGIISIAAGDDHALALKSDGSVWAWGANGVGQLGNNGTGMQGYAVQVQSGAANPSDPSQPLSGIISIAAGEAHSLAVTSGGGAYGWGEAALGRLGDGYVSASSNPRLRPVAVLADASTAFDDAISAAAGGQFSLILSHDGSLWAFGNNASGQLGDGSSIDRSFPTRVKKDANTYLNEIVDMAAGATHALALDENGKIYTWGGSGSGQLGNGSTSSTSSAYGTAYATLLKLINSAPSVSLSLAATSTIQPGAFTLTVTPTDVDGNLASVEIFKDGISLGSKTAAPWVWQAGGLAAGSHEFAAAAVDTVGAIGNSNLVSTSVTLPTVTVSTSTPLLSEGSVTPATFTITRQVDAPTSSVLTVHYTVGGTATNGIDYQSPPGTATIPAGQSSVSVSVTPIVDTTYDPDETLVLTLVSEAGSYSTSSPSTATVTLVDALPVLNGLRLKLQGDKGTTVDGSGKLSSWLDQSGLGNTASQSTANDQPVLVQNAINGRPLIRFNGTSQYLILPNVMAGATAGEIFVVLKALADEPSTYHGFMRFGTNIYGSNYPWVTKNIHDDFGTNVQYVVGDPLQRLDQYHLYNTSSKTNEWIARINGAEQFKSTSNAVSFHTAPWIGKQNYVYCFAGDIAEVVVYDRVVSASERESVGQYLNSKYQFVAAPTTPSFIAAKAISSSQVSVVWTGSTGATGYSVERKGGVSQAFVEVAAVDGKMTGFIDSGLVAGTEYTYRVRARALGTFSGYSSEAVIKTAYGNLSLPVANVITWLQAGSGVTKDQDGNVSQVIDWSGQGHNATQTVSGNQPLWVAVGVNKKPVFRFDGTNDFLNLAGNFAEFASGLTAIVVGKPTNLGSWQRFFDLGAGSGANNIFFGRSAGSGALTYRVFNGSSQQTWLDAASAIVQNQFQMFEVVHEGTTVKLLKSGTQLASGAASAIPTASRTSNFVGKSNWTSDALFQGDIAEILVFNSALTATQRQEVEKYLSGKYNFGLADVDTDGDGLSDWTEFSFTSSAVNVDTDADDLGDGQEYELGTNPTNADSDGDGMPDGWEYAHGLNPAVDDGAMDFDGDGISNFSEWQAGTGVNDYYNGQHPILEITGGDRQTPLPGVLAAAPLEVTVRNAQGALLVNAPIDFVVTRSQGRIALVTTPTALTTAVQLRTDAQGKAAIVFEAGSSVTQTGLISATEVSESPTSSVTFIEAMIPSDDSDGDTMPDGWEIANGLKLFLNDASLDLDGDELANIDEYRMGTKANVVDSDTDGMPDGWEVANQSDPLANDSAWDINGTGLTNLQWYGLSASRVGQWRLDEGSGTTAANAVGDDDGTLLNGPLWIGDPEGGSAISFDGIDDYLTIANPVSPDLNFETRSLTVTFRIKTAFAGTAPVVAKGGQGGMAGYNASIEAGHLCFAFGANGQTSESLGISSLQAFNDDQWHHVACEIDRSTKQARIYVDGIAQTLSKTPGTIGTLAVTVVDFTTEGAALSGSNSSSLVFGSSNGGFNGALDQVELYERALSHAEIEALAAGLRNRAPMVAMTQPATSGSILPAGVIELRANAFDLDGTVAKVEFFDGQVLLGPAAQAPFHYSWSGAGTGAHSISAKATDNRGAVAWSASISMTTVADSNTNGIPDEWEIQHFGSLNEAADGDFDGDGVSNRDEYRLGRNPTKAADQGDATTVDLELFTPLEQ